MRNKDPVSEYGITVGYYTEETKSTLCRDASPDPRPFKPKIKSLRHSVKDYHCAKFQVIPIRGFRFIVLTL